MRISARKYLALIRDSLTDIIAPELHSPAAARAATIATAALDELLKRDIGLVDQLARALPAGVESAKALASSLESASGTHLRERIDRIEDDLRALAGRPGYVDIYWSLLTVLEELMRAAHGPDGRRDATSSPPDLESLAQAANWENGIEQAQLKQLTVSRDPGASTGQSATLTAEQLEGFLKRTLPDEQELEVLDLEVIPAGMVHDTYQFKLRSVTRAAEELIVRKTKGEPFAKMNCFELHKEFDLVKCLSRSGYMLPEPYWLGRNVPGILGDFYIMRKAQGSKNADLFNVSANIPESVLMGMAEKLGELHSLPLTMFSDYIDRHCDPAVYSQTAEQATRQNLAQWYDCWKGFNRKPSAVEVYLFAWLTDHVPHNPSRASLLHTDFTPHNCLWEDDRLTAVLDWEAAHFGDPAEDIAYIKPHIAARMDWDKFLAHYREHGGATVDERRIAYFTCYAHMRTVVLGNVLVSRVENGENNDLVGLQADFEYLPRILEMCLEGIRSAESLARATRGVLAACRA